MSYLINAPNVISSLNSTSTLLTAGQVFTGTWEDVTAYNSLVVAPKTDQNGTYSVQFSPDGTNLDSTLTRYYRTTQIEPPHRFTITRQYTRVVFTNTSSVDQTYLRLQTTYGEKADLNAPADSTLAQDFDATVVRPTKYEYEVALGQRQGHTTWNKWGYNADVDIGTETIWSSGGTFSRMTTAGTLDISSTSTADASGSGIGAQSIIVYGVDASHESQIEVVALSGTNIVTTAGSWFGVNRLSIYAAGTSGINVGNINAISTTTGQTQGQIPANEGSTQQALFFTQAGHTALMDWLLINIVKVSGSQLPVVTVKCWVTSQVSGAKYEVFRHILDTTVENTVELSLSQPFVVGEKSIIEFQATTDKADTSVSVRFSLIEVRAAAT